MAIWNVRSPWNTDCMGDICVRYGGDGFCEEHASNTFNVPFLKGLECVFGNIVTVVAEIALLVVFIMLVVGGFKYLTAGGDAKAVDSARGTITNAILGLFALVVIWLLLKLISVVTGLLDLTQFRIGV